jgi:DNA helicase-2/ATP-dependent DNA helicase PcrA
MLSNAKKKLTLVELYDLTLARSGYKTFIKDNTPDGDERWENLEELRRVTAEFGDLEAEESLPLFLERVALVSDVDALNESSQRVSLLTLHTAKGLEYPVVFMIGMEEGLFPHSRSLADPEQMEEERRLAYVGMTRAKDRLYLIRAFRRSSYGFDEPTMPPVSWPTSRLSWWTTATGAGEAVHLLAPPRWPGSRAVDGSNPSLLPLAQRPRWPVTRWATASTTANSAMELSSGWR